MRSSKRADSADGRGGKKRGRIGVGGVGGDRGERLEAKTVGFRAAHEDEGGGAVGDGAGVCRGDCAAFAKRGLEMRDFVGSGFERELVVGDDVLGLGGPGCLAGGDGEWNNFRGKAAVSGGFFRAGERCEREFVLLVTGKSVALGAVFSVGTHETAFVVGVLESVEKHVIEDAAMAHAITGAGTVEEIRSVAHALHAAGDDDLGAAGKEQVVREHDGLHAGAAHLVDGDCAGGGGQSCAEGGLASGSLAEAGGEHTAEENFVDGFRRNATPLESGADGGGAELGSAQVFEIALKCANGRARGADNHDGIRGCGHLRSSSEWRVGLKTIPQGLKPALNFDD